MESQTLWTFLRAMLQIPPKRFKMTQGVKMDLNKPSFLEKTRFKTLLKSNLNWKNKLVWVDIQKICMK